MTYEAVRSISLLPVVANVINANRFVAVVAASNTIDEAVSGGDAIGVSLIASAATEAAIIPVALLDGALIEVEAGAIVAVGARVMSDATGRAITAVGATARTLGWAMQAAGAAGEFITVLGEKAAGEFVA